MTGFVVQGHILCFSSQQSYWPTYLLTKTNVTLIGDLQSVNYKLCINLFSKLGVLKKQKITARAGRLGLCFLWANHLLASSIKQVYLIPYSYLKIETHRNLLISICPQGKNAVLMQVTNLPTRTTGLHPTSPVVCPPCELFWPVREITGWKCSLHVGSCYIWTEDFHKSKVNIWPVYSTRLCTKGCISPCSGHLAAIMADWRPQACFI